jgi:hypothetical protein
MRNAGEVSSYVKFVISAMEGDSRRNYAGHYRSRGRGAIPVAACRGGMGRGEAFSVYTPGQFVSAQVSFD